VFLKREGMKEEDREVSGTGQEKTERKGTVETAARGRGGKRPAI